MNNNIEEIIIIKKLPKYIWDLTHHDVDLALYYAAYYNRMKTVKKLINYGVNPLSAFILSKNDTEILKKLLKLCNQRQINLQDELGNTPVMNALILRKDEIVVTLLNHHTKSDLNIFNKEGLNSIMLALDKYIDYIVQSSIGNYLNIYELMRLSDFPEYSYYTYSKKNPKDVYAQKIILKHAENCKIALLKIKELIEEFDWVITPLSINKKIIVNATEIILPKTIYDFWSIIKIALQSKNANKTSLGAMNTLHKLGKKKMSKINEKPYSYARFFSAISKSKQINPIQYEAIVRKSLF